MHTNSIFFLVMSIFHLFSKKWNSILDCRIICSHWDVKKNSYFLKKYCRPRKQQRMLRSGQTIQLNNNYSFELYHEAIYSFMNHYNGLFFFFRGIIIIAWQFCLGLLPNKCEKFYKILLWLLYSWYYIKKCYNLILIFIGKNNFYNIFACLVQTKKLTFNQSIKLNFYFLNFLYLYFFGILFLDWRIYILSIVFLIFSNYYIMTFKLYTTKFHSIMILNNSLTKYRKQ